MINILVADPYTNLVDAQKLELAAEATLQRKVEEIVPDLSIVIEGDDRLQELNREFLDIDAPPMCFRFHPGRKNQTQKRGVFTWRCDHLVSSRRGAASAAGHPILAELQLLVIHGVLHLLGYDHAEPEDKALMWTSQTEILRTLGVSIARLPE